MQSFHEDTFYKYFRPYRHPDSSHDIWGGLGIETFGEDVELLRRIDRKFLWTVLDGENGKQWIVEDFHWVNRICHLVTEKPHNFSDLEFRVSNSSLTDIGLKRQINMIQKLIK